MVASAEYSWQGPNARYVVTNLPGEDQELYNTVYCARGDMENRIKEQQLGLFADRISCQKWWPNQFRFLLSSVAYVIQEIIRRLCLGVTDLAGSQINGSVKYFSHM